MPLAPPVRTGSRPHQQNQHHATPAKWTRQTGNWLASQTRTEGRGAVVAEGRQGSTNAEDHGQSVARSHRPRRTGFAWRESIDARIAAVAKTLRSKPAPSRQNRKQLFPGRSAIPPGRSLPYVTGPVCLRGNASARATLRVSKMCAHFKLSILGDTLKSFLSDQINSTRLPSAPGEEYVRLVHPS